MTEITERQAQILDFVQEFTESNGFPPSYRDIARGVGLKAVSNVHFHINKLREKGLIEIGEGKMRSIRLAADVDRRETRDGYVPLVGNVAAGTPILAEQNIEDYVLFDTGRNPEEYFALRVRGDSMIGAGIMPDDIIIAHQQPTARNGEIVVALFENEATMKTLSVRGGEVWLLPENENYEPINGKGCVILGKVVGLSRNYSSKCNFLHKNY